MDSHIAIFIRGGMVENSPNGVIINVLCPYNIISYTYNLYKLFCACLASFYKLYCISVPGTRCSPSFKMTAATKALQFGKHLKELRIHLCQTSSASRGVR